MAGHELFGHGSGKLIYRDQKTGKCPLSIADPLNPSEMISTCYEKGETYSSRFGDISTSFEECKADITGLFLSAFPEMYTVFNWDKTNSSDLQLMSMLAEVRKGILGMASSYNEE